MTIRDEIDALPKKPRAARFNSSNETERADAYMAACDYERAHRAMAERLLLQSERGNYCLAQLMQAYERRIRTDCKSQEEIDKRPWECAEYVDAAQFLRQQHPNVSAYFAKREAE